MLSGSQDGTARLYNLASNKVVGVLRHGRLLTLPASEASSEAVTVERPGVEEGDDGHPSIET